MSGMTRGSHCCAFLLATVGGGTDANKNGGRTNAVLTGQQRLIVYVDVLGCAVS